MNWQTKKLSFSTSSARFCIVYYAFPMYTFLLRISNVMYNMERHKELVMVNKMPLARNASAILAESFIRANFEKRERKFSWTNIISKGQIGHKYIFYTRNVYSFKFRSQFSPYIHSISGTKLGAWLKCILNFIANV